MTITTADILKLVQRGLEEFDDVPLSVTTRRAIRIANLLGEHRLAIRLLLEVRPRGGAPEANRDDIMRLMRDPALWAAPEGDHRGAVEEFIKDRAMDDGTDRIAGHALAEFEFWAAEPRPEQVTDQGFADDLRWRQRRMQIVETVRGRVFAALCQWERSLGFAATNEAILAGQQRRVDDLLKLRAPDVLERFNAVIRRLTDAAETNSDAQASEELSQAVTSCRRVLKSVVDTVQPADPQRPASDDGHALTDEAYRNRLFEFLKGVDSETFGASLGAATDSLFARFGAIDKLASKGVHARVARDEAEFCALNTYLLAGEVLRLHLDATPTRT